MTMKVVAVGECMVELSRSGSAADGALFALAYGGDTFNTAAYLARAPGITCEYLTAVGDDPYSDGIIALAQENHVGTDLIARCPGRMPGLYLIETDRAGERSFWYWRETSPARTLFDFCDNDAVTQAVAAADALYFSGITLSILDTQGLGRLSELIVAAKAAQTLVVMDSNFRPRGWPQGKLAARETFGAFWRQADIAMPTFEDEAALFGASSPTDVADRLIDAGASEVVVKQGGRPALIARGHADRVWCAPTHNVSVVDTTAAGDAFNAGYLAGRLQGLAPEPACEIAHQLAGAVIGHRGAIVPQSATAVVLEALGRAIDAR